MKQLTTVMIIFLPMMFITRYFGMNFDDFVSIYNNERYFWSIILTLAIGTAIIIMREVIYRWFVKTV
jgi:Mg2+ and Co2+ transporter CorA